MAVNAAIPTSECVPRRCPPATWRMPRLIHSVRGGRAWTTVARGWSQSLIMAAPAVVTAPSSWSSAGRCSTAIGDCQCVSASQAAAPVAAWDGPIMGEVRSFAGPGRVTAPARAGGRPAGKEEDQGGRRGGHGKEAAAAGAGRGGRPTSAGAATRPLTPSSPAPAGPAGR